MKHRLQRVLTILCVLALAAGCLLAGALADEPKETRVITVSWNDENNRDGLRPDSIEVKLGDTPYVVKAPDWILEASVPVGSAAAWSFEDPTGYHSITTGTIVTRVTFVHTPAAPISVTASVTWDDGENSKGVRPESVRLHLKADGENCGSPKTVSAATGWKATWGDLPEVKPGTDTKIVYTVEEVGVPDGYEKSESGLTVTNKLQTVSLSVSLTSGPADAGLDLSGIVVEVTGPDPSLPQEIKGASGSLTLEGLLPGAYAARAKTYPDTPAGADEVLYALDGANSSVADAAYIKAGQTAALSVRVFYKAAEAIEGDTEDYKPEDNEANLAFLIDGPDSRMPMRITYAEFKGGKYEIDDLAPGTYIVKEMNAETLVDYYTLSSESVTAMMLTAGADGAKAVLFNKYIAAPTPTPSPDRISVPVTKTWNDNSDEDGNRPDSITVRLYADGVEVASHVLTEAEDWRWTFEDLPRYQEDNKTEINYTISEDAVPLYTAVVNGYNIVNNYEPQLTRMSVTKVWRDDNNASGLRPDVIAVYLYGGGKVVRTAVLSAENNWYAEFTDLPAIINGQRAEYYWVEQRIPGYMEPVYAPGENTVITNELYTPGEPPEGDAPGKRPGPPEIFIDEYGTPLGVDIEINHVGDCFD